ncbi:hypothetical protein [Pantoea sp. At-9b]|uniref:hypothetical protein n=1 Tax=Pantoea sp. (strain At-9b) TaxID=592316 RepID=UPI0001B40AAC|nr:hypothetical protein [Pantoea sp. At-9b]ADU72842.1 NHL repeat containing protein [Pantoea sp. At-9b]
MSRFSLLDLFRGKALTIPPLDGPLQPNTALDDAAPWLAVTQPDNLSADGDRVLFSSGNQLLRLPQQPHAAAALLWTFAHPIISMASRPGGGVVLALADDSLWLWQGNSPQPLTPPQPEIGCITAMLFIDRQQLVLCSGSRRLPASEWSRDLLLKHREGSVWLWDLASQQARCLAAGLGYPQGVCAGPQPDTLLVTESWRHRVIALSLTRAGIRVVLDHLPAYPSRIVACREGHGFWLSCFAPRNRLVEFVLQEKAYRHAMLAEVAPEYWIAPAYASGASFLEPLQCGGIKVMGVHKPWSPSRSWGLVVRLDQQGQPLASYHSRADGQRHGVNSVLETADALWVASRGGNVVMNLRQEPYHA